MCLDTTKYIDTIKNEELDTIDHKTRVINSNDINELRMKNVYVMKMRSDIIKLNVILHVLIPLSIHYFTHLDNNIT